MGQDQVSGGVSVLCFNPCFGNSFSAVQYITNAPSFQIIEQLVDSQVL